MNCERIRELLSTDYIDGQISEDLKKEVQEHLGACSKCKVFQQNLIQAAREPFHKAEKLKVPTEVWYNVKKTIAEQNQRKNWLVDFLDNLQIFVQARKPALAFAAVMVVILLTIGLTRISIDKPDMTNVYLEEQIEFLVYLSGDIETDDSDIDYIDLEIADVDFDTSIEKYLL